MRSALWGALLLTLWVGVVTLVHAVGFHGTEFTMWARDAVTYLLVPAGVVLAIDASGVLRLRTIVWVTTSVGAIAAYSFSSYWLQRRATNGAEISSLSHGLLTSFVAITVPLAVAVVIALGGRRIRWWWLAYGVGLIGSVLLTGTRTGLVMGIVLIGVCGSQERLCVAPRRVIIATLVGSIVLLAALPLVARLVDAPGLLEGRVVAAVRAFTEGLGRDESGVIRARAYAYAARIFGEYPVMGQGVGALFESPSRGRGDQFFNLDTPLVYLAKFGVLGSAVLVVAIAAIILGALRTGAGATAVTRGAVAVWIALLPFGPPTEDKGFALAISLLILIGGLVARTRLELPSLGRVDVLCRRERANIL